MPSGPRGSHPSTRTPTRSRPSYLGVGWLWYLGTLVPMIGLVQVGMQARADRYMYLPLVGLSIVLTWGTGELVTSNRRKLIAPLAGAALIALAIVTRLQLDHWENSIALFERAVTVTERNRYGPLPRRHLDRAMARPAVLRLGDQFRGCGR